MVKVKKVDGCRLDEISRDIYLNIEDWIPELLALFNSRSCFEYIFFVLGCSNCLEFNEGAVILGISNEFTFSEQCLIENILLCKLEDFNIYLGDF